MIVRNRNINPTDSTGKECFEKEQAIFSVLATEEDINNYAGKQIDVHWHEQFELFVLDQGKALVSVDGKEHELVEKQACYIGPNSLHGVKPVEGFDCRYRSLVVHPNIISGLTGSIFDIKVNKSLQDLNHYLKIENNDCNIAFFDSFNETWNALDEEPFNFEFKVRNGLSAIYLFLDSLENAKNGDHGFNVSSLKEILEWIESQPEKINCIEDLSDYIHLSVREVQRIFRQNLNCSPMEYVRRKRILKSAEELIHTNKPIIDIAYKYGFSSPAHYTVTFKKIMGCKPLEYRKKIYKC